MKENYTEEFKKEAIRLVLTSDKSQRQIAKDLGVTEWAISTWKKEFDLEKPENRELKILTEERIRQFEKEGASPSAIGPIYIRESQAETANPRGDGGNDS